jgi:hypothetical protein
MLCLLTPFRFQTARFAVARVCTQQALPPSPPATHPSRWRLPRPPPPMHALCSWPCVWPPTPCLCPPSAARGRATLGAAVSVRPRQHTCSCLPAGRVLARARASHVCCHDPRRQWPVQHLLLQLRQRLQPAVRKDILRHGNMDQVRWRCRRWVLAASRHRPSLLPLPVTRVRLPAGSA